MITPILRINSDNISSLSNRNNIYIYGGGYTGQLIIKKLKSEGIFIKAIIDDDKLKIGKKIDNIRVIPFEDIFSFGNDNILIIISTIYAKSVLNKLNYFTNIQVAEMFDFIYEDRLDIIDGDKISELNSKVNSFIDRLKDEYSKKTIDGVLKYFKSKDRNEIVEICTEEPQYFINEVVKNLSPNAVIVDAGSYRGELINQLEKYVDNFKKWICIEADSYNVYYLKELEKQEKLQNRIFVINKGLWNKTGSLYFEKEGNTNSKIVDYRTDNKIDVISIDELNIGEVNFIKMDIEGAELMALKGAINTIKKYRPILAISIYHSLMDYCEIPIYLMNQLDEYDYYIRQHAVICCETVMYAIPKNKQS